MGGTTLSQNAISAKRYALLEASKLVEAKGHGLGYLVSPIGPKEPDWMEAAWKYILHFDGILRGDLTEPPRLDRSGHDEGSRYRLLLCLAA